VKTITRSNQGRVPDNGLDLGPPVIGWFIEGTILCTVCNDVDTWCGSDFMNYLYFRADDWLKPFYPKHIYVLKIVIKYLGQVKQNNMLLVQTFKEIDEVGPYYLLFFQKLLFNSV
jgi:hypothetical protein